MASALPTDSAMTKSLDVYGLGTYDGLRDGDLSGEDEENSSPPSLPGIPDIVNYDPYIGYPQSENSQGKHASFSAIIKNNNVLSSSILGGKRIAISGLPNDPNIIPRGVMDPNTKTEGGALSPTDVTDTTSNTSLPSDTDPSARSDYYDSMQSGSSIQFNSIEDMWAKEDSGAYVSSESLPTLPNNDQKTDNYTSPMGNYMSGFVVEDQSVPEGFPSEDFLENSSYPKSNTSDTPGGNLLATRKHIMDRRVATDINLVVELTGQFLKDHGKKNITRRAVTAFLQSSGNGDKQYIASDIIRCLKHNHNIIVPDALDVFPVKRASFVASLNSIHSSLVDLEIYHSDDKLVSNELGKCAVSIASIMSVMNK